MESINNISKSRHIVIISISLTKSHYCFKLKSFEQIAQQNVLPPVRPLISSKEQNFSAKMIFQMYPLLALLILIILEIKFPSKKNELPANTNAPTQKPYHTLFLNNKNKINEFIQNSLSQQPIDIQVEIPPIEPTSHNQIYAEFMLSIARIFEYIQQNARLTYPFYNIIKRKRNPFLIYFCEVNMTNLTCTNPWAPLHYDNINISMFYIIKMHQLHTNKHIIVIIEIVNANYYTHPKAQLAQYFWTVRSFFLYNISEQVLYHTFTSNSLIKRVKCHQKQASNKNPNNLNGKN